jgi:hypothetical protein
VPATASAWPPIPASSALGNSDATPGAALDAYIPPLSDNAPPRTSSTSDTLELGFNATVVSNCIVPRVKGKTARKARSKLRAAGCKSKVVKKKGGRRVTKQRPRPGTEVPPGTAVKLTLGSGGGQKTTPSPAGDLPPGPCLCPTNFE